MTDRQPEPYCGQCDQRVTGGVRATEDGRYRLTPCGHIAETVWR